MTQILIKCIIVRGGSVTHVGKYDFCIKIYTLEIYCFFHNKVYRYNKLHFLILSAILITFYGGIYQE